MTLWARKSCKINKWFTLFICLKLWNSWGFFSSVFLLQVCLPKMVWSVISWWLVDIFFFSLSSFFQTHCVSATYHLPWGWCHSSSCRGWKEAIYCSGESSRQETSFSCSGFFRLRNTYKLQHIPSLAELEKIIHVLVSSCLDYCNALITGLDKSIIPPGCTKGCSQDINSFY